METVREYCQVCGKTTTWNITKVTSSQVNKEEDIIAIRCVKCGKASLRKVGRKDE